MAKVEKKVDISDVQFSTLDKALFGTLFAMSKVYITLSVIKIF